MPAQQPRLAKLTRPRLARAVPRERLFARLDEPRCEDACLMYITYDSGFDLTFH